MRDLFLLAILPFMLYPMAKRPFIALGMWIWTAMFFPNAWVYGPATAIRFNLLFTVVAVLGYLLLKHKPKFQMNQVCVLILVFFVWTTLTSMTGIGRPEITWEFWSRFMKVVILFMFVQLIMEKKLHIDFFLWCVVLSIGFYGGYEALKFVASGGGHMIAGHPGHVLGDRNELAVAFVMTLPLCFYLLGEYGAQSRLIKLGLLGMMAFLVAAIIGTQSRGGFIAMLALASYLFVKSDRKILLTVLVVILVAVLSHLVSDQWAARMDTINAADQDASFMGRVVAWKLSFIMAMNNPFFGGGYKALEFFPVWTSLSQEFFSYPFFYTGEALPDEHSPHAAHSVYFQVLGDHGFIGLAIYLAIIVTAFRQARRVAANARKMDAPPWIGNLATMLQLSIFAFCLGGAALSFAYFDLIFAIYGIVSVLESRILPSYARKAALK